MRLTKQIMNKSLLLQLPKVASLPNDINYLLPQDTKPRKVHRTRLATYSLIYPLEVLKGNGQCYDGYCGYSIMLSV